MNKERLIGIIGKDRNPDRCFEEIEAVRRQDIIRIIDDPVLTPEAKADLLAPFYCITPGPVGQGSVRRG